MWTGGVVIFVIEIWATASGRGCSSNFWMQKVLTEIRKPPRPLLSSKTPLLFHSPPQKLWNFFIKNPRSHMATKAFSSKNPSLLPIDDAHRVTYTEASVSPQEWQGWGTISPVPSMVNRAINDLNLLQKDSSACMMFDGNYGKLSGGFKLQEDRKHRAKYASLSSSEEKLQFYSARQVACRLLGSRGYLCQKLLASPGRLYVFKSYNAFPLAENAYLVVYASKEKIGCSEEGLKVDFLRQNNTRKLLWQVFGVEVASLCLFGIAEDDELCGMH
ncbi:hypothetical protein OROMI_017242 [Orobanche minor]